MRLVEVAGLIDAGAVLVGMTPTSLVAYDKSSGKTAWEAPGTFTVSSPSRAVLWSFSRATAEKNWSFGTVTPVNDGLWVDSYKALVKLGR